MQAFFMHCHAHKQYLTQALAYAQRDYSDNQAIIKYRLKKKNTLFKKKNVISQAGILEKSVEIQR